MTEAIVGELSDLLWERVLARDPLTALRLGRQVESLPPGGPEDMEQDVSFAVSTLGRLAGIGGVDAAFLRDHLQQEAAEAQRFWYRFPVTPYNALPLSAYREEIFEAAELAAAADAGRYLSLLNDYAALVEQIGDTMQVSLLAENTALYPIRREQTELRTFALTGYLEGWAGYAAGLCDEIGMYTDPLDRYGRMTSERFFAARMVVDTGLNVLGWSLDRAAACLRESGFMSESEIASELLRYAVDDPGQALGYHAGHRYLRELRGTQDIREFHDAVLASGPLPLRLLRASLAAARPAGHDLPRAPGSSALDQTAK